MCEALPPLPFRTTEKDGHLNIRGSERSNMHKNIDLKYEIYKSEEKLSHFIVNFKNNQKEQRYHNGVCFSCKGEGFDCFKNKCLYHML